jgi:hypothetical protein
MGHRRLRSSVLAFGLAAMLGVLTAFSGFAATTNVTVTPSSLSATSWYFYDDTNDAPSLTPVAGKYEIVAGPAKSGVGSVRLQTIGSERWNIATSAYANTPLSALTVKFNTFQPSAGQGATCAVASNECAIYLNFDVDFGTGLPGYQRRLVYVPGANGAVAQDTWQEWDATAPGALWTWSGCNNNCAANPWPDGNTSQYRTWQSLLTAFPAAHVNENAGSSQLLFRAGEPYPLGFIGYIDTVTIGVGSNATVFDFEPFAVAQDKDDCKNGGWQTLHRANGTPFKNQGDCVSYTNNGK